MYVDLTLTNSMGGHLPYDDGAQHRTQHQQNHDRDGDCDGYRGVVT